MEEQWDVEFYSDSDGNCELADWIIKLKTSQDDPEFDSRIKAEKMRVDIAVAIAKKREEEGFSQKVIANIAHLTQQQISKIENGENCNIDTYFKAMAALGMNFNNIVEKHIFNFFISFTTILSEIFYYSTIKFQLNPFFSGRCSMYR